MGMDFKNIDALFFDFDGVIADSVNIKTEAFRELYKDCGEEAVNYVVDHHTKNGGMSRFLKIRHYHEKFHQTVLSEDEVKKVAAQFSALVVAKVVGAPYINGALSFLEEGYAAGKRLFIVSGTPEEEIQRIIKERQLAKYFTEVKGSPVSKQDHLASLLKEYTLDTARAVFFGDSNEDRRAADALGVKFIPINFFDGKSGGYKDFEDLRQKEKVQF